MPDTPMIAQTAPYKADLQKGKTYFWCTCGQSANQPFCDGPHKATPFTPLKFNAEATKTAFLLRLQADVEAAFLRWLTQVALASGGPCRLSAASYLFRMEDTRVLYNETCPVCSFEIDAYRKRAEASGLPIRFDTLGDAARWGLTSDQAARRLHVLHRGRVLSGIPAFRALWGEIPHLHWLARLTGRPFIGAAAVTLYDQVLAPLLYWMHKRRQARR